MVLPGPGTESILKMRRIALPAAALLFAASVVFPAAAQTTRLEAAYAVYLTGFRIGNATVTIDLSDRSFVATGSAKSSGLIRIVSRGSGSMNVRGSFKANRIVESTFSGRLNTSRRDQKIELGIVNGFAKEISIEPPPPDSDPFRVPITKEARTNVVDPLSAALFLLPAKGDLLSPDACNRTLPIFDGRYRFNLVLSYLRTEKLPAKTEGYEGNTLVCQVRYVPIAGHRDRATVQQMAENREMFVWLAPIAGTRALAPVKASVSTSLGTFVAEATRFRASPAPD